METILLENTVNTMPGEALNIGSLEQVPVGEGRVFEVGETSIAVFRTRRGEVFATQTACPHKQGPLVDGIIAGSELTCPLHAYKFDLATGNPVGNDCRSLRTYTVSLAENGDILLSIQSPG